MDSFLLKAASVLDKEIELMNRRLSRSPINLETELSVVPVGPAIQDLCSQLNVSSREDTSDAREQDAGTPNLRSNGVVMPPTPGGSFISNHYSQQKNGGGKGSFGN